MREILFRGKAINRDIGEHRTNYKNGDWVYGLVTRLYDERFENLPAQMTDVNGVSGIEVDCETIGQFTGLTDKNGKKIFEGDVISHYVNWLGKRVNAVVKYDIKVASWVCEFFNNDKESAFLADWVNGNGCEVIGNIHDNPELLKGE